jgi:hypothetical protein
MIGFLLRLLFPKRKKIEMSPEARARIVEALKAKLAEKQAAANSEAAQKTGGQTTGQRISENETSEEILTNLKGAAVEGASLVGVAIDDPPLKIVTALNAYVLNPPPTTGEVDKWTDRALPLGSLWGEQMVREFGWEWASVTFHDKGDSKATGVFTKDRSLAVYPWHFVYGCLQNGATVTILLAFNMLAAGKITDLAPGQYDNLMDGVHHIVPPA